MKVRTGTLVEMKRDGIVPRGTTGEVKAIRHNDYLVEWNAKDPSRAGNLRNWHSIYSLLPLATQY